jgi:hypothetical protein
MPDTKISGMTPTAPVGPELVPVVQAGNNFSVTCAQIAALGGGGGGGPIWVTPGGMALRWQNVLNNAFWQFTDSGHADLSLNNGFNASFSGILGNFWILSQSGGSFDFQVGQGNLTWGAFGGGLLTVAMPANSFTIGGFTNLTYQYIPIMPGNWTGGVSEIQNALDRLAAAIVARTVGGAIP